MNYWHMQLHPDNKTNYPPERIKKILENYGIIGYDGDPLPDFDIKMKPNDIVAVKSGQALIALCEVVSDKYEQDEEDEVWFSFRRKVKVLAYNTSPERKLPQPRGTLAICANMQASTSKVIHKWHQEILMTQQTTEAVNILKQKKQIILQGAPGTGKTYISAEIAMKLIEPNQSFTSRDELMSSYKAKVEAGQIAFTTFHQSVDYEEFVEGLKPITEDGQISYSVQPGIFKRMCEEAATPGNNFDDAYAAFIRNIESTEEAVFRLKTATGKPFGVSANSRGNLNLHTSSEMNKQGSLTKENILSALRGTYPFSGWESYFGGVIEHLKFAHGLQVESSAAEKNYVLIIDEINRGNISKILGELITLLEADKRVGAENQITAKLPYSHTENPDAPEFGVPSNLYIIGTMNTADRSVGHIDYAIRRRFAFITLRSEVSAIENYYASKDLSAELKAKAIQLFESVSKLFEQLTPDFDKVDLMVGHSYFMAKDEDALQLKLQYEIKPLLHEYVKDGILKENAIEMIEGLTL